MVNNKDFGKRIQKIMDYYAVSASSFADYMGVGRSSISHILSGRNKPSLDFVMKITEAYTDVDIQWLLYGKGTFPKSESITEPAAVSKIETPVSVQQSSSSILEPEKDLFSQPVQENENIKPESTPPPPLQKISGSISDDNEIDRIVIFYADGSFNSYQMKKS
ncbi:helix-turn-helix domain-containing protein [Aquimarina mytili]|uniref:Helix-turn-helix domain-containing protein n=1 Tax=Aquimarina mytili TaxID=874423 RepID=A0A937D7I0_9FLAO|nr:helix-turn-helix domain-containing protein [Aquimarina mytili]MBL0683110.1 helix-turn-helix domain-containing protein [Aquimarina mytili]